MIQEIHEITLWFEITWPSSSVGLALRFRANYLAAVNLLILSLTQGEGGSIHLGDSYVMKKLRHVSTCA